MAFDALVLDRGMLAAGQAWRLWTGHLVHVDAAHAALNLAALAILAAFAARMRQLGPLLLASLLLMPGISLGLLLTSPELQWYAGLSGLLHGWAAWLLVRRGDRVALAGLLVLGLKLAWEALPENTVHAGVPVAIRAHQLGAAGGLLLALASRGWRGGARLRSNIADDSPASTRDILSRTK